MSTERWTAVDDYFSNALHPSDAALTSALEASDAAGMPAIHVSPAQGRMLQLLAESIGARRVLEVGTLAGYSTICLARALPSDGRVVTLELDPKHAAVARANLDRAGVGKLVDIRVGPALQSFPRLAAEGHPPFDLAFIDADKPSNADYFSWALRLVRPGGMIIVDNVARAGAVVDARGDENVQGVRRLVEVVAKEPRVRATAVQTVGAKGYDGFLMARVVA
jgi:predicted O-methyltransferase YrrM